jgi:hypothetical protein
VHDPYLDLRLRVIDWCNTLPAAEQEATAEAWSQILDHEAEQLTAGGAWLPTAPSQPTVLRRRHAQKWARMLGHADGRLAIIVADQVVAALIRGHFQEVNERP